MDYGILVLHNKSNTGGGGKLWPGNEVEPKMHINCKLTYHNVYGPEHSCYPQHGPYSFDQFSPCRLPKPLYIEMERDREQPHTYGVLPTCLQFLGIATKNMRPENEAT